MILRQEVVHPVRAVVQLPVGDQLVLRPAEHADAPGEVVGVLQPHVLVDDGDAPVVQRRRRGHFAAARFQKANAFGKSATVGPSSGQCRTSSELIVVSVIHRMPSGV